MKRLVWLILLLTLCLEAALAVNDENRLDSVFSRWHSLPTDSLYTKGLDYYAGHQEDSALICFTICADRPVGSMSVADKALVVKSLTMSARLYFRFYDYGKAYEQLARAMTICADKDMGDCMTGFIWNREPC